MIVHMSPPESRMNRAAWITAWATVVAALVTSVTAYVTLRDPGPSEAPDTPHPPLPMASCRPPGAISAKHSVVAEKPDAIRSEVRGGVYTLTSTSYDKGGLFIELSASTCNYQLDFNAELIAPSDSGENTGWGYQIGPCNTWDGKTPRGSTFGYAFFQGSGDASAVDNSFWGLAESPVAVHVAMDPDYNSHHWTVLVVDTNVLFTKDLGAPYGPYPLTRDDKTAGPGNVKQRLPTHCQDAGVFIRVFNSQVRISDLELRSVKS